MTDIAVTVNGRRRPLDGVAAHATALDWLRDTGLTGSKEGCAEGECGACAVLLATPDADGGTAWTPVNACLVPLAALDGQEIVTVEGSARPRRCIPSSRRSPRRGGSQCGYCTPGFVCSMAGEYYRADRSASDESCHGARRRARPQRLRPARAQRQPLPLHRLPADPRRRTRSGCRRPTTRSLQRLRAARAAAVATDVDGATGALRPADDARRGRSASCATSPEAVLVAGATDWGVEVNIRGTPCAVPRRDRRLAELRALHRDRRRRSRSARR